MKLLFQSIILIVFTALPSFSFNNDVRSNEKGYDYEFRNLRLETGKQQISNSRYNQDYVLKSYDYAQRHRRNPRLRRYYPRKSPAVAAGLSAFLPGLGQAYADRPGRGAVFLLSEIALFAATGFNFGRYNFYADYADRYDRFRDKYSDSLITSQQGYVKARGHRDLGAVFMLGLLGVHAWNIFDAAETAKSYNMRRWLGIDVKFQPTDGTYITLSRQF